MAISSDYYIANQNINTKSAILGKDATQLGMDDFFNLLVAQMTNQDMMNPQADTEYISQMAQFTTLRGIQTIQEYQLSSYAASYTGKTVAIAHTDDRGDMTKTEGVVTGVTFYDGEPKVVVNGVSFPLYSVMEVKMPGSSAENDGDNVNSGDNDSVNTISQSDATAYIGKEVRVSYTNSKGEIIADEGIVTEVLTDGDGIVKVVINDSEYPASAVKSVR